MAETPAAGEGAAPESQVINVVIKTAKEKETVQVPADATIEDVSPSHTPSQGDVCVMIITTCDPSSAPAAPSSSAAAPPRHLS